MKSRGRDYFERLYAVNPDPWDFSNSPYELEKYAATVAVLEGRRFRSCLEIGCSIGVLTGMLANSCDNLLAVDIVQGALDAAAARCAGFDHVSFKNLRLPEQWPYGAEFDLIVISEVLYFLNAADIARLAMRCSEAVMAEGLVLLVNYTGEIEEPCNGDEAAYAFISAAANEFSAACHVRRERFRIDVLQRDA